MNIDGIDRSELDNAEVVESLGNMMIVKIDGEMKQVPASSKNELLYKHKLYSFLHPDKNKSKIELTEDKENEYIAIKPTDNSSVYQLWVGSDPYPLMNPPRMAEKVLKGVKDALNNPSHYGTLKNVYDEIKSTQVRRPVIEKLYSVFPKNEIIPEEDGWNILGMFILTWDARIFLNTGDIEDKKAYKVRGGGVTETEDAREFLQLSVSQNVIENYKNMPMDVWYIMPESVNVEPTKKEDINCPSCQSEGAYFYDESDLKQEKNESRSRPVYVCQKDDCRQAWQRFDLTEREIEFISKARWLLNHRKEYNDDTFWDIVESYVLKTNG